VTIFYSILELHLECTVIIPSLYCVLTEFCYSKPITMHFKLKYFYLFIVCKLSEAFTVAVYGEVFGDHVCQCGPGA
jgi:hypothetical protein